MTLLVIRLDASGLSGNLSLRKLLWMFTPLEERETEISDYFIINTALYEKSSFICNWTKKGHKDKKLHIESFSFHYAENVFSGGQIRTSSAGVK